MSVREGEGVGEAQGVADGVTLSDGAREVDECAEGVIETEAEAEADTAALALRAALSEPLPLATGEREVLPLALPLPLWLALGDALRVGAAEADVATAFKCTHPCVPSKAALVIREMPLTAAPAPTLEPSVGAT